MLLLSICWVWLNGFPMVPVSKDGHTYLYLDKDVFDPLFKMTNTGEVDDWGILFMHLILLIFGMLWLPLAYCRS